MDLSAEPQSAQTKTWQAWEQAAWWLHANDCCRRHRFGPRSRKTPRATEQLSSRATATKARVPRALLLLLSPLSRVRLRATPQTAARQAPPSPPSWWFCRQGHWRGLPLPSPLGPVLHNTKPTQHNSRATLALHSQRQARAATPPSTQKYV